ncbi:MAG: Gfo/Idh/MocA family oxidoreductase [Armatimonadetes bacterium]|nr:Gfo/Idh/MocA family oxidoreductase [Armatimonadota bacterium]
MRIGILSFAHIHADSYMSSLKGLSEDHDIFLFDNDPARREAVSRKYGEKVLPDYHELAPLRLDAAIATGTNREHCDMVLTCAREGVPVLCEKPIALSLSEARAMIEACEKTHTYFQMAYPCRFLPAVTRVKEIIEGGQLGEIACLNCSNHGFNPGGWFADPIEAGGGAVMDHTVHVVDLLRWLLKCEITSVYAEMDNTIHHGEVEDCGILSLDLSNGAFASLDPSWSRPASSFPTWGDVTMEIVCAKGVLFVDAFAQNIHSFDAAGPSSRWLHWGANMDEAMISDFLERVNKGLPPQITGEDGLRALEVVMAAYRSRETGQLVSLPLTE